MSAIMCGFLISEYWEGTARDGHLKDGAPDWVLEEYDDFMKNREENLRTLEAIPTIRALHPELFY